MITAAGQGHCGRLPFLGQAHARRDRSLRAANHHHATIRYNCLQVAVQRARRPSVEVEATASRLASHAAVNQFDADSVVLPACRASGIRNVSGPQHAGPVAQLTLRSCPAGRISVHTRERHDVLSLPVPPIQP